MNTFFKIIVRTWTVLALGSLLVFIATSPVWIADFSDEWGVLLYCVLLYPIFGAGVWVAARPFVRWFLS